MPEKKFENALKELEEIISKLEDEGLPLEESISLYEKGIKLSKICAQKLSEAQKKIDVLSKSLKEGN